MENNNIFVLCRDFEDKEIYYQIRQDISNIRFLKEDLNMNNNVIVWSLSDASCFICQTLN